MIAMNKAYIVFAILLLGNIVGIGWHVSSIHVEKIEDYKEDNRIGVSVYGSNQEILAKTPRRRIEEHVLRTQDIIISPGDGDGVYDNETLKLSARWDDNESTASVRMRYSFDYNNWTEWKDTSYDSISEEYYLIVPDAEWKNHIGGDLYWEINRTLSNGSNIVYGNYTVKLYDDDPDAPVVHSDVDLFEAISEGDGVPESDEEVYIEFSVYDQSGIKNVTVEYYVGNVSGDVSASLISSSDGTYYFRSDIFGPLPAGDLEIIIHAWDDDYDGWIGDRLSTTWNSTTEGIFFTIKKEKVDLNMEPSEIIVNYSDQCLFSIKIRRNDGGMSLDNLTVYLNISQDGSQIYFTSNDTIDGETSFLISPRDLGLEPGQYDVEVFYGGSDFFAYASNKTWLHVWIDTAVEISINDTLYYGQHIIIEVKLWQLDDSNTSLVNRPIEVYGNLSGEGLTKIGENFTDSNGIARIYWIVNVSPSTLKIVARYFGAVHYYSSEAYRFVSIQKSNIDIDPFNSAFFFVYSDWGIIRAYVYDEFSNNISDILITLYIYVDGGQMYIAQNTSHNGILVYNFESVDGFSFPSSIMPGNYTCMLLFSGNENYYQHSSTFKLVIEKEIMTSVVIEVNQTQNISIEWGDTARIMVSLDDNDDNPVLSSNITIYFIIDNETISVGKYEVVDGVVLVDVNINFDVGSSILVNISITTVAYTINCSFSVAYIRVISEKIIIESQMIEYGEVLKVKYSNSTNISFTLIDNDGNFLLGNYTVNVLIEGLNVNLTLNFTLSDGILIIKYPFNRSLLPSMYMISIINIETDRYELSSEYKFFLEIEKLNTYSSLIYCNLTYSDVGIIRLYLYDELNNTISGSRVVIYIEDIFVENITNENGIVDFYFEAELKPNNYTITVNWGGTKIYYGGNTTYLVTVHKEKISIDIKISGEVILWGNAYIEINITDDEGEIVSPLKILVYVENVLIFNGTYTGFLRIKWSPFKEGTNTIKVVVIGNEYYDEAYYDREVFVGKGTNSESTLYIFVSLGIGIITVASLVLFSIIKKRIKSRTSSK